MRAFVLTQTVDILIQPDPLKLIELPVPEINDHEICIKVSACGVCHTELDEIEGRLTPPHFPIIPGHQVVGYVNRIGAKTERFRPGDRVGVAWINSACGNCRYCRSDRENLCADFQGTGMDVDGGYAEFMKVDEHFAYPIPQYVSDVEAAPLLCAGAIGFRALQLTGLKNGDAIGLTGFGGSGHLVIKMIRHIFSKSEIFVFARDPAVRSFALELGAFWTGDFSDSCPKPLQAVIDTTPVWFPVLKGLESLAPGGRLVINAIRKETYDQKCLLDLDYGQHLWQEKEIKSVANITRNDVEAFLQLADEMRIRPRIEVYPFEEANKALYDLKSKRAQGSKVLQIA